MQEESERDQRGKVRLVIEVEQAAPHRGIKKEADTRRCGNVRQYGNCAVRTVCLAYVNDCLAGPIQLLRAHVVAVIRIVVG
jgi:hypothetical protein